MDNDRLQIAKNVPLDQLVRQAGFTPVHKNGRCWLKEHDSFKIFPENTYCHFSRLATGGEYSTGTPIDFCIGYMGMSMGEAIDYLLEFAGVGKDYGRNGKTDVQPPVVHNDWNTVPDPSEANERKQLELPEPYKDSRRVIAYLTKSRGIDYNVVMPFVRQKRIYECAEYHNCVFVTYDGEHKPRYAFRRGTNTGSSFKADVTGSDKSFGFPVHNPDSDRVIVFEAPIDLLSYMSLYPNDNSSMIALGCLSSKALLRYLEEYDHVDTVSFLLDSDEPARVAEEKIKEQVLSMGYKVEENPLRELLRASEAKDVNEYLKLVHEARQYNTKGKCI